MLDEQSAIALWGVAGAIAAALIGAAATLWAVKLQKPRRRIRFNISQTEIIDAERRGLNEQLSITYKGECITRLIECELSIYGIGRDLIPNLHLKWDAKTNGQFIQLPSNDDDGQYSIRTHPNKVGGAAYDVRFPFLNPGEVYRFRIISTDDVIVDNLFARAPELTWAVSYNTSRLSPLGAEGKLEAEALLIRALVVVMGIGLVTGVGLLLLAAKR